MLKNRFRTFALRIMINSYLCIISGEASSCGKCGPGFKTPLEAMKGPREKLLYFPCIPADTTKQNYLCTVDCDPDSEEYGNVSPKFF